VALGGPSKALTHHKIRNLPNIAKHLINDHVEMSGKYPPKKARVARGKRDGKYLGARKP
jgi:hypothetical protein